ncbi:MAG: dihydroorotate dehydrogenase [Phycisphaerae bacterium]|nr:dihydroorotate dehydrogenase [Phycisphaerae bacterium]
MDQLRSRTDVDLSVDLAGIQMQNPLTTASGTSGYGPELSSYVDLSRLGAFTTKSITVEPREGNPAPRIVETRAGVINSIGLANVGLEKFLAEKLPSAAKLGVPILVNVAGKTIDEYLTVASALDRVEEIAGLEINISCPNVAAGGLEFGTNCTMASELIRTLRGAVKRAKLIVKLSPNVTDICEVARAAVEAGADALSLINTLRGMAINVEAKRPVLPRGFGGLSGPAVHPVAVYCVWRVYREVAKPAGVPIIGLGGVQLWQDAMELMLAGATAVAIGTALFIDPQCPIKILDGMTDYCRRHGVRRIADLIGTVAPPTAT